MRYRCAEYGCLTFISRHNPDYGKEGAKCWQHAAKVYQPEILFRSKKRTKECNWCGGPFRGRGNYCECCSEMYA